MNILTELEELRALYGMPGERALRKELAALESHGRNFIARSPFLVLATHDAHGALDASPRGGEPGFVRVSPEGDLLIPDAPGNNRLDSLQNILQTRRAGLLFMIPGIDETLRINGSAVLTTDPGVLQHCAEPARTPKLVIRVTVQQAYMPCAKAFMRSRLWSEDSHQPRGNLPSLGQIIRDQTGLQVPVESQDEMIARYRKDL